MIALLTFSNLTKASDHGLDSIPLLIPEGLHEIGHTSYSIKEGSREMTIQFWYPAEILSQKQYNPMPILDKTHFSNLIEKQSTNRALWKKNAKDIKKAILNEENLGYPLMVFFEDVGMDRLLSSALYKKLASNGFIVVTIDLPDLGISMA